MKIAVLMYGHMRTFKCCFNNLNKHLLSRIDADLFIHSWNTLESITPSWHTSHICHNRSVNENEINLLYRPKFLRIDRQPIAPKNINVVVDGVNLFGFRCMYYSLYAANRLRKKYEFEKGFKYDVVIKIRPDILLKSNFPTDLFDACQLNHIFFSGKKKRNFDISPRGYTAIDIINVTKANTMDRLCSLYHEVDRYFHPDLRDKNGFVQYLDDKGVTLSRFDYHYDKDWYILREQ